MGYLTIDHRGGQGIDEKDGRLAEFDTIGCGHCTSMIAVLKRPTETAYLANMDIARSAAVAQHLTGEYTAKFTCRKCKKPVCRTCARACASGGECKPVSRLMEAFFRMRA